MLLEGGRVGARFLFPFLLCCLFVCSCLVLEMCFFFSVLVLSWVGQWCPCTATASCWTPAIRSASSGWGGRRGAAGPRSSWGRCRERPAPPGPAPRCSFRWGPPCKVPSKKPLVVCARSWFFPVVGHFDLEQRCLFRTTKLSDSEFEHAKFALDFFRFQVQKCREAIWTWTLVGIRNGVVKDIRRLISHMIWDARDEAKYAFPKNWFEGFLHRHLLFF